MAIDYLSLISKHTEGQHPKTVPAFIIHSALVTKKALDIARAYAEKHPEVDIDFRLLEELGMVHDIGIFRTETPALFTNGNGEYLTHITHGVEILEEEGLPTHARAALTHTGISQEQIAARGLPLPDRDHLPETIEEEILCLADFYYSKNFSRLFCERTPQEIRRYMAQYGQEAVAVYDRLAKKYL